MRDVLRAALTSDYDLEAVASQVVKDFLEASDGNAAVALNMLAIFSTRERARLATASLQAMELMSMALDEAYKEVEAMRARLEGR